MRKYFIPLIGLIWYEEFNQILRKVNSPLDTKLLLIHFFVHGATFYILMGFILSYFFNI